jgi:hypothetical protein
MRAHEAQEWCEAILELMRDPSLRERMRRLGPIHTARYYHPRRLARVLAETVYGPLLPTAPRRVH